MSPQRVRDRLLALFGFGLRMGSLGGRFVFIFFAAVSMTPTEFGVYGIIGSAAFLINQLVGLEAYQRILRRIAQNSNEGGEERAGYFRLVCIGMLVSALLGTALGTYFGWTVRICLLAAVVIATEYVATEVNRALVAENRPILALSSGSIRVMPWNLGLPLLTLLNLLETPWSIELVLVSWIVCSIAGTLFIASVFRHYCVPFAGSFGKWYWLRIKEAPPWLVTAMSSRFLENGVRLLPAFFLGEIAAGHFILLSTLASIGSIGVKAAIEPFWFVRMVHAEEGQRARRQFMLLSACWLLVGALISTIGLIAMSNTGRLALDQDAVALLVILTIGSAALSLSQGAHFALYAAHRDGLIMKISGAVLVLSIVTSVAGTAWFGLIGAAIGYAVSSIFMFAAKTVAARKLAVSPRA